MQVFYLTLSQMLLMFALIVAGFILRKKKLLPDNADKTMSKLETFLITPALNLYTQMTKCNVQTFKQNWVLIIYGSVLVLCAIALAYPLSRLFVRNYKDSPELTYQRNIYKYAMTFGNYGFMGNFIILGVFGEDMFFKYSLFCFGVGIMCTGWGLYILIPKQQNAGVWKNLKKGLFTPMMIALVAGIILGLLNVKQFIPDFLTSALQSAGNCQGPIAMVLAGFVIGGYNFKQLITDKKVYIASFLRLIAIPAVVMLALMAFDTSDHIKTLALVCFATPLGLNTIVYPAAYGGDTKTGASMTMISHTLSVITIPLMFLLFITIL